MGATNPFAVNNSPFAVGTGTPKSTPGTYNTDTTSTAPTAFNPTAAPPGLTPQQTADIQAHPEDRTTANGGNHFGALTNPDGSIYYAPQAAPPPPPGSSDPNQPPAYQPDPVYNTQLEDLFKAQGGDYNDPTATSGILKQLSDQANGPTNSQTTLDTNTGRLSGPTSTQTYFDTNSGGFTTPGASETTFADHSGDYNDVNAAANANTNAMAALSGPNALDRNAGAIASGLNSATNVADFSKGAGSGYNTPGALENFAASDLNGTNPYYKMLQQQGSDAINQQLAARGAYGSGGALASLAKFTGDLSAQQYQQEGQLQNNAQTQNLARLAGGSNLARDTSNETLNRNTDLQNLFNQQFQDTNAAQNTLITAGANQDKSKLDALSGLTNMAHNAENDSTNRLTAGSNAAAAADNSNVQDTRALGDLSAQADASNNTRNTTLLNAGNDTDTQGLNKLNSLFNQAGNTQGAAETRINDQLSNYMKATGMDVSAISNAYNNAGTLAQQNFDNQVNALMQSAAFKSAGAAQQQQMIMSLLNQGIKAGAS